MLLIWGSLQNRKINYTEVRDRCTEVLCFYTIAGRSDHVCSLLHPLIHQHAMEPRCSYRKHKQRAGVARNQRNVYATNNRNLG